ncbi:DinB family protein [Paenibacillus sp. VCA1]|uniref:DinB family protein n=1 Tax=Paenibacillus sp. VCA1 TaxID=3039148 RepID=UPI002870BAC5|nr:DinB family protein [Paenibacillus sp. VCA1]MDR9855549.1 DinB family protein [Paenibacillus sp. VCA1]
MDTSTVVIDFLMRKYKADQKWTRIVIEQLSEEDILWSPTPESNSIANLVAHISGAVYEWFETVYFGAPNNLDRSKEFDRGLQISKEQILELSEKSYDCIIKVLEIMKANPEKLLEQPYINYSNLNGALDHQATALEMLLHQFRHLPSHTGQIIYIAKMRKGHLNWEI